MTSSVICGSCTSCPSRRKTIWLVVVGMIMIIIIVLNTYYTNNTNTNTNNNNNNDFHSWIVVQKELWTLTTTTTTWNNDTVKRSSSVSFDIPTNRSTSTSIPTTATTTTNTHNDCLVHEPLYVTNVIRHPRLKNHKNKNHSNDIHSLTSSNSNSTTTNSSSSSSSGEYMIHPSPQRCGTLRRTIWKTGYTIENDMNESSVLSNLAYEIEQRQSNCALPLKIFHMDNQNGLGAHLHLWSQAYCNAISTMTTSTTTTTSTASVAASQQQQQQYRMKTFNPDWLWRDQTYCRKKNAMASPWTCYFPKMEDRCPNDDDDETTTTRIRNTVVKDRSIKEQDVDNEFDLFYTHIPNVTSPYKNYDRCLPLQWPAHKKNKLLKYTARNDDIDNITISISKYISEYRAATTEFIFQSIHPMIVQEAERQIGLLFDKNSISNPNPMDAETTTTATTSTPTQLPQQRYPSIVNDDTDQIMVPPDMITVHLRWGDKFFEMDLVSIEEYVDAILDMLQIIHDEHENSTTNDSSTGIPIGNTTTAHIYLACEDPTAVSEFLNYTQQHYPHWNVYVDRSVTELHRFRPNVGNRASWATKNTMGRAGLIALGSLLVSMESKYYILTTGSNWSRIMNELRLNVIQKRCCNDNNDNNNKHCTHMIDLRPGEW